MSNKTKPRASSARPSAVRQAERQRASRRIVLAVVGGAVLLAAAIAIAVSAGGGTADAGPQTAPVAITGAALTAFDGSGADAAVGTAAPDITGTSFDGTPVAITADGRPKVVMFVAHWCPHCQAEVPRITEWLADSGMPADVDLYAVATGTDSNLPNYPPSKWLEGQDWPITTMADDADSSAAAAFGLKSYPYFVVLDGDGTVLVRASGELTQDQFTALLQTAATG